MLRRRHSAGLLAAAAALACAAPAAANDAGSITKSSGGVSATVAWDAADFGVSNPRLAIARAGAQYAPRIDDVCGVGCILAGDEPKSPFPSMLKVVDLDGDHEPEVLVDTFSGGVHCCLSLHVLRWTGADYARSSIEWGDVSYALKDLNADKLPEIVGHDPVFSAAFSSFAASRFPPMVLRFDQGTVQDVTRQFPKLAAADVKRLRRQLRKKPRGEVLQGILAAYVADQYLLGKGPAGLREVDRQRRAHRVGKGFKKSLLRFLKRAGYG